MKVIDYYDIIRIITQFSTAGLSGRPCSTLRRLAITRDALIFRSATFRCTKIQFATPLAALRVTESTVHTNFSRHIEFVGNRRPKVVD